MRNLFTPTLLISILSLTAKAQIQKGALLTGGSISYNSQENDSEGMTNYGFVKSESDNDLLALRPQIGLFVTESLLIGMGIGYEYRYRKSRTFRDGTSDFPSSRKSNSFSFNPYLQKFYKLTDNLFFSPSLNMLIGGGNVERNENENTEGDIFEFRVNISPGLTYFVSEKWAVSTTFGQIFYNRTREDVEPASGNVGEWEFINKEYGFDLSFNSFSLGIQYYLRNNPE